MSRNPSLLALAVALVTAASAYEFWPRSLPLPATAYPSIRVENGRIVAPFPARVLLARVGEFDDGLSAYLWFDYLRSQPALRHSRLFLVSSERANAPGYQLFVEVPNDALGSISFLSSLETKGYFESFDLRFSSARETSEYDDQTRIFVGAYQKPTCARLEALSFEQLRPSVAHFVAFKSRTDPRTHARISPRPSSLGDHEAADFAADIIAVAKFYDLPLDAFLGIGAMENNYLAVDGDLHHVVWKRRPVKGDIVLDRRRHRALVSDYSMGVWQISRETLRHAHTLYLRDDRDYTQLPRRLRPVRALDIDSLDSQVMTTYGGLLLRNLLDRFHGDVARAVGAYNGGPHRPNLQYAASVDLVAVYARNVLQCGVGGTPPHDNAARKD